MSNLVGELAGTAASTVGETIAVAAGSAGHTALSPISEAVAQKAWSTAPIRLPVAEYLALGVAQGQVDAATAKEWARKQGFGDDQWQAMVDIANTGPAIGQAMQSYRRGDLTDAEFDTALQRAAIEPQWWPALRKLRDSPLEPAEIAKAIHRNIMRGDGLLLVEPSSTPGRVPAVAPSPIDPTTEAAWSGIDHERLRILVGNAGLPPGVVQGLELLNRGAITEDDFSRLVGESNLRQEWGDVLLELRRRLLTPHEYAELRLRGWITPDERDAGAALSGMEAADAQLLDNMLGRPLPLHQVTTGEARGGSFGGDYEGVPEPYRTALRQSNVRPEWGNLAYANRYTVPSYFILRAILQSGGMTEAEFADYGRQLGWPPDLADKAAKALASGGGSGGDPHVGKAQTQLWNALHKSYVDDAATDAQATADLEFLGITAAAAAQVLATWGRERALVRRLLTPTEIRKAIGQPGRDQAWALERLKELGMDDADAQTFLAE